MDRRLTPEPRRRGALRLKLGARADYIQTAYRLGYKFEVRP